MLTNISVFFSPIFQGSQLIQAKVDLPSDKSGTDPPITSFIRLEYYNAIKLVKSVHSTLSALSKVIRGSSLLTSEVQTMAGALLMQEVSWGFVKLSTN